MKYMPSIALEEMSGSAKGVTAAKTKSRKYIRNRGYGGPVRTADQAKVKGIFKQLTTQWKSLSDGQILAWNKLALSQEGRSVLGSKAKIPAVTCTLGSTTGSSPAAAPPSAIPRHSSVSRTPAQPPSPAMAPRSPSPWPASPPT